MPHAFSFTAPLLAIAILVSTAPQPAEAGVCNSYRIKNLSRFPECEAKLRAQGKLPGAQTPVVVPKFKKIIYVAPNDKALVDATGATAQSPISFRKAAQLAPTVTEATQFVLAAGKYTLTVDDRVVLRDTPGAQSPAVEFIGTKDTQLIGPFTYNTNSAKNKFSLFTVRSNTSLRNFSATGFREFATVAAGLTANKVELTGLSISKVQTGIIIHRRFARVTANDWLIDKVNITAFNEGGIHLAGSNVGNIVISNSLIDATNPEKNYDCWIGGVQLFSGVHDVTVKATRISNIVGNCAAGTYQQGDGVEADDYDGIYPNKLIFENVFIENTGDGGVDLKAFNVLIRNSNFGASKHYPIRLWRDRNAQVINTSLNAGKIIQITDAIVSVIDPVQDPALIKIGCGDSNYNKNETYGKIIKSGVVVRTTTCKTKK